MFLSLKNALGKPLHGAAAAPSYDANAQAYFTAVEAAGGSFDLSSLDSSYTEAYTKEKHNDLFVSLSSHWSKIGQFVINCAKTGAGISIPAKGAAMTTANFTSGNYTAAKTGSPAIGLSVNSSISQTIDSADAGDVLTYGKREDYTLISVCTATGYSDPNYGFYYSQSSPSTALISTEVYYDKLLYHIGQNGTSSIVNSGYSNDGFLEFNKEIGQARIKRNGTTLATSGYFSTNYYASADWKLNWSTNSYSAKFPLHMSFLDGTVPSDIKTAVRTFLAAFGDTTIPA